MARGRHEGRGPGVHEAVKDAIKDLPQGDAGLYKIELLVDVQFRPNPGQVGEYRVVLNPA